MRYEASKIYVANKDMEQEMEIVNAHAAQGWEPYAVSGNFHYFRRQVSSMPDMPVRVPEPQKNQNKKGKK